LARYTSFRIGGPADVLVQVETVEALQHVCALAAEHAIPVFVLGGGSNLLIRDGGIRGIVLTMRGTFRTYHIQSCSTNPQTALLSAGAGCPVSRLAMQVAQQGWGGLEFAYGIPGTLGGAMVMNAGTYLGDIRQVLLAARVLLRDGQMCELPVQELGLRYRGSSYPAGALVLQATLRMQQGERETMVATMRASHKRRQRTQPLRWPNAGSIFKNPPEVAAARLIDELGLKGTRIGGAMISPIHANFVVNVEHATAADVEALVTLMQARVQEAYGITLEPEVRFVGEEVNA
jgi:UDP-N-acetylmuramate dehydrogenase